MKLLKRALLTFGILLFVLYLISLLLPAEIHVERSITINAPVSAVFAKVNDLKSWNEWSPWFEKDPDMQNEYSPVSAGKGAWNKWTSESQGSGKQTITKSRLNKAIASSLEFEDQGDATSGWTFEKSQNGGTKVTWSLDVDAGMNPIMRYFGLKMDEMVGADYETGLANLKKICEKPPQTPAKVPAE